VGNIGRRDETPERPQGVVRMPTYSRVSGQGRITLPASVRKELGIEEGDLVEIDVKGGKAVLKPKKMVDESQAYFWTKSWQEAESEADKDIKARRVKTFDTVDELIKDLDRE
jgi:AbrB family looped-hinge helix DNA binding protein